MLQFTTEELVEWQITGHDDPINPHPGLGWFTSWMLAAGVYKTDDVTWMNDGHYVQLHVHATGLRRTWELTEHLDNHGCRLGVWPD